MYDDSKALSRPSDEQYDLLRAVVDHTPDLITVIDATGNVVFANKSHETRIGSPAGELLHKNAYDLVHPDDRATLESIFEECFRSNEPQAVEYRILSLNSENTIRLEGFVRPLE